MCSRYELGPSGAELQAYFDLTRTPDDFAPLYNIAITNLAPICRRNGDGERELVHARFGLIPAWSKEPKAIGDTWNARSETMAEKPLYRAAYRKRRCLVPANGFYEFVAEGKRKRPFLIHRADDGLFAFAGLWEQWSRGGQTIDSFAIITSDSCGLMAGLHNRQPVFLNRDEWEVWLDASTDPRALFEPRDWPGFEAVELDGTVNSVKNKGPECLARLQG